MVESVARDHTSKVRLHDYPFEWELTQIVGYTMSYSFHQEGNLTWTFNWNANSTELSWIINGARAHQQLGQNPKVIDFANITEVRYLNTKAM